MTVSIDSQIAAVEAVIRQYRQSGPRRIGGGQMRPAAAELQLMHLDAALRTLRWLKANEAVIRAKIEKPEAEKAGS